MSIAVGNAIAHGKRSLISTQQQPNFRAYSRSPQWHDVETKTHGNSSCTSGQQPTNTEASTGVIHVLSKASQRELLLGRA